MLSFYYVSRCDIFAKLGDLEMKRRRSTNNCEGASTVGNQIFWHRPWFFASWPWACYFKHARFHQIKQQRLEWNSLNGQQDRHTLTHIKHLHYRTPIRTQDKEDSDSRKHVFWPRLIRVKLKFEFLSHLSVLRMGTKNPPQRVILNLLDFGYRILILPMKKL